MAGEIIRQSRDASGKQSQYACAGNTAQSDEVNHPCNAGGLPKDDPDRGVGLVGARVDVMELRMRINSEAQVVEDAEGKTFGCSSAIASSPLPTKLVKGKTLRKRWPSRTRISSASLASPRAILPGATRYSGIGMDLLLHGG
jgi:NifU-like protein involved in Fe-S cluster formation